LYYSYIKVLVDAAVLSEDEIVIKWDFRLGSVERSIDLYQRGYTSAGAGSSRRYVQSPPPIKNEWV
jgi:hypothetical protein